jgi:hypothetical protein
VSQDEEKKEGEPSRRSKKQRSEGYKTLIRADRTQPPRSRIQILSSATLHTMPPYHERRSGPACALPSICLISLLSIPFREEKLPLLSKYKYYAPTP